MVRRSKLGTKLTIVGALAVGAIGASTYAGLGALQRSGNDAPAVRQSVQYERLIADVQPATQYLVEPYLAEYRVLRETRPAERAELIKRIRLDRTAYTENYTQWQQALSSDPVLGAETELREALLEDAHAPAETFWQLTIDEFLPAVEAGRTAQAAAALDGPITQAFATHRGAIDNVVTLAQSRRDAHVATVDDAAAGERRTVLLTGAVAALVLLAAGLVLARTIQRPLRRLADAADRARDELGRAVATIEHSRPDSAPPEITPLGLDGDDEIGVVVEAFEAVRSTALDLATKHASSRRSVGELFVNLGRRNQALINRQLSFIDQLERTEEDPDTLADLFRLDHLATRMRRNAESLLVLAGAEQSRRWTESIDVGQVVRSALSEIEDYNQVDLGELEPVLVRGGVVADVAHLLAELLENATSFSPPSSRVVVTGRMLPEGYVVSVIDEGIGMDAAAIADANKRIESVGRRDAPAARVLGLHVVGCLAARHSIRVRLVPSTGKGVTARVLLPPATIEPSRGPQSPIQAVAAAAPAIYEQAISRLEDAPMPDAEPAPWVTGPSAADDVEPLPTRRRGATPPPEPERFDPWPDEHAEPASFASAAPDDRFDASRPFDVVAPAAAHDEPFEPFEPYRYDAAAEGVDDADDADDGDDADDVAFAEDLAAAIRDTFAEGRVDDDVWPPAGDPYFADEPDLPPLPEAYRTEPPLPWLPTTPHEPATFTSWRPEDPADEHAGPTMPPTPALSLPLEAAPPAMSATGEPAGDADAPGGLVRRVRGAQLPDAGPARRTEDDAPRRSADDVRSQLSRFRAGVERGRRDERSQPNTDEGDRS